VHVGDRGGQHVRQGPPSRRGKKIGGTVPRGRYSVGYFKGRGEAGPLGMLGHNQNLPHQCPLNNAAVKKKNLSGFTKKAFVTTSPCGGRREIKSNRASLHRGPVPERDCFEEQGPTNPRAWGRRGLGRAIQGRQQPRENPAESVEAHGLEV